MWPPWCVRWHAHRDTPTCWYTCLPAWPVIRLTPIAAVAWLPTHLLLVVDFNTFHLCVSPVYIALFPSHQLSIDSMFLPSLHTQSQIRFLHVCFADTCGNSSHVRYKQAVKPLWFVGLLDVKCLHFHCFSLVQSQQKVIAAANITSDQQLRRRDSVFISASQQHLFLHHYCVTVARLCYILQCYSLNLLFISLHCGSSKTRTILLANFHNISFTVWLSKKFATFHTTP